MADLAVTEVILNPKSCSQKSVTFMPYFLQHFHFSLSHFLQ